jgi:predicted MFS family arabinose efflux permease
VANARYWPALYAKPPKPPFAELHIRNSLLQIPHTNRQMLALQSKGIARLSFRASVATTFLSHIRWNVMVTSSFNLRPVIATGVIFECCAPLSHMRYRSYLLALLTFILAFNFADRIALGVVMESIKRDLDLTDTKLGLLSGMAFAIFYSLAGIPLARWADRSNRVTIISLTTAIWSVAVALCGAAGSFAQLLLVRVFVAVGEAGCIPPGQSLIADHFNRAERPRAAARYMMGLPLAMTVGYFAAGILSQAVGWRWMFVVIALPGLVLATLATFTLRDPRAHTSAQSVAIKQPSPSTPSLSEVLKTLGGNQTFRHLLLCFIVWYFFAYGLLQWQPTFFIRSHGLSTGRLGVWLAIFSGGGALIGTFLGGEWGSRFAAGNERVQLIAVAIMFSIFALFNMGAYLAPTAPLAFILIAFAGVIGNMAQGPVLATIQSLVPPRMRAVALAIVYLFANLVGMGLGPLAVGALSDAMHPWAGDQSLRYALLLFAPGYFWAAWHALRASRTVMRDLADDEAVLTATDDIDALPLPEASGA